MVPGGKEVRNNGLQLFIHLIQIRRERTTNPKSMACREEDESQCEDMVRRATAGITVVRDAAKMYATGDGT